MILRRFVDSDIPAIDEIWKKHHSRDFSVPDRKSYLIDACVEDEDGKLIAYGQVKLFAEAMFILDLDASLRKKIEALKLLMAEAFRGLNQSGLNQMYAFIRDPDFERLITKHFGFAPVEDAGQLLLWER